VRRGIYFIIVVLLVVGGAFALARFLNENSDVIQLKFIYWQTKEVALGSLVLISFFLGVFISSLFLMGSLFSKYFEARRLRRENTALQKMMEIREKNAVTEAAAHSSSSK